jgi:sarcosine oxidase subunit gamma
MAEPACIGPLAGLTLPARAVAGPEPVTLAALPFRGKLILRGGEAVLRPARDVLGLELPGPLRSTANDTTAALWLGPDEWLLLLDPGNVDERAAALRTALAEVHHAVVAVTGIGIAGEHAADVLNAGCPLDLHEASFPLGAATRTLLAKAPMVLHRPGRQAAFELWVNGSFAPYAWLFLENAGREYGLAVTG